MLSCPSLKKRLPKPFWQWQFTRSECIPYLFHASVHSSVCEHVQAQLISTHIHLKTKQVHRMRQIFNDVIESSLSNKKTNTFAHPNLFFFFFLESSQCRDAGVDWVNQLVRTWPEHQHHRASATRPLKCSCLDTATHTHSTKWTTRDVIRHDSTLLGNTTDSCRQIYSFTINMPAVKKNKQNPIDRPG